MIVTSSPEQCWLSGNRAEAMDENELVRIREDGAYSMIVPSDRGTVRPEGVHPSAEPAEAHGGVERCAGPLTVGHCCKEPMMLCTRTDR